MSRTTSTLVCAAFAAVPLFVRRADPRVRAIWLLVGAAGVLMNCLAETRERAAAFTPSHELSEAVADPDVARTPHLRNHLE